MFDKVDLFDVLISFDELNKLNMSFISDFNISLTYSRFILTEFLPMFTFNKPSNLVDFYSRKRDSHLNVYI